MRRRIVIALLALGTVVGYGSGVAHAIHHRHASCAGAASGNASPGWHPA
jgi:hypothetical protein